MTLFEFIKLFPSNFPHPDKVSIIDYHDNDHELDWNFSDNRWVNIVVSSSGDLIWDATIDSKIIKGKVNNPTDIPEEIYVIFKQLGYEREK